MLFNKRNYEYILISLEYESGILKKTLIFKCEQFTRNRINLTSDLTQLTNTKKGDECPNNNNIVT